MTQNWEPSSVYEIDVNGKYILLMAGEPMPRRDAEHLSQVLRDWLASDETFLVISGDCVLTRIDKENE